MLQLDYSPGIRNANRMFDMGPAVNPDLRARQWRHTALVISHDSIVRLHTDGSRSAEVETSGRPFTGQDELATLRIGDGAIIDGPLVHDRAVGDGNVSDYHAGMLRIRQNLEG